MTNVRPEISEAIKDAGLTELRFRECDEPILETLEGKAVKGYAVGAPQLNLQDTENRFFRANLTHRFKSDPLGNGVVIGPLGFVNQQETLVFPYQYYFFE